MQWAANLIIYEQATEKENIQLEESECVSTLVAAISVLGFAVRIFEPPCSLRNRAYCTLECQKDIDLYCTEITYLDLGLEVIDQKLAKANENSFYIKNDLKACISINLNLILERNLVLVTAFSYVSTAVRICVYRRKG